MVRITQQNDWVIFIITGCILLYTFMLISLHRDSTVKEFLQQKFPDSSNNFLSWTIISIVFCLVFSTLISRYIPVIPKKIIEIQFFGYELNKFGFTFMTVSGFYFIRNILSYLFFAGTGASKKWEVFYFTTSKFYFVSSILLILGCIAHYLYNLNPVQSFDYYFWGVFLMFIFKLIFYITHKNSILPEKWYYKFLYICTLQIIPVLVLWKVLFF